MASSDFHVIELGEEDLDQSKLNQEIEVALLGATGSGKSHFVNAIRRLKDGDKETAKTGVANTTTEPGSYVLPHHPDITLHDLPGHSQIGNPDTKSKIAKPNLNEYDAFLLFVKGRITNNDLVLAKQLKSTKKPFLVIRTHVDVDVRNESRKKGFNEETMLNQIRLHFQHNFREICKEDDVFLIGYNHQEFDFNLLERKIIDLPLCVKNKGCLPKRHKSANVYMTEKLKKMNRSEESYAREIKRHFPEAVKIIKKYGIQGARDEMKRILDEWKTVKINLAIVGSSGAGKSSLINSIRGLPNDDDKEECAKTGVTETTGEARSYDFPSNKNVKLWDLPGLSSTKLPNVKIYCEKMEVGKYQEFVIVTNSRFTNSDMELATKLKSMGKPFFFVRSHIDVAYENEKKKSSFKETEMLEKIRNSFLAAEGLNGKDVFLISNNHPKKWNFPALTEAIKNGLLQSREREAFNFSMVILSKKILEGKVKSLRGRIWMVAFLSVVVKIFRSVKHSRRVDFEIIVEKVEFYRSQLGFPEEGSEEMEILSKDVQKEVERFYLKNTMDVESWLRKFDPEGGSDYNDEESKLLPWLSPELEIDVPYKFVSRSLHCALNEMEKLAVVILNEIATASEPEDMDID